jgi:sialidase-1
MVLLQTSFAQEQTDVFISGEGGYHTYRIPALIVTGKGTLLAFCEGRKTSASDAGDIDLLVKRSTDEGATWSDSEIAHEEGGDAENTIGNPCPIVDTSPSVAHLLFTRNNERIFYTSSDDDGNAWAAPIEITNVLEDFDFPWTRVGTGPGHGLQLSSGRLIVPVWLNERIGYNYRSSVIYSDDGGATWHAGGLVGPEVADTNECMAVEMSDGTIYLNMRAKDSNSRTVAWSEDGGVTWSAPLSDVGLPDSVCQASVLRVDERVLFTNPSGPGRANLLVRESDDGAKTWHIPRTIHDGPSAYSDLAISRDGETVFCLYECGATGPYECLRLHRISLAE